MLLSDSYERSIILYCYNACICDVNIDATLRWVMGVYLSAQRFSVVRFEFDYFKWIFRVFNCATATDRKHNNAPAEQDSDYSTDEDHL